MKTDFRRRRDTNGGDFVPFAHGRAGLMSHLLLRWRHADAFMTGLTIQEQTLTATIIFRARQHALLVNGERRVQYDDQSAASAGV
ncbi:MAG: hypothetical protein ACREDY_18760 [Bradyrhizobium sp.]